MILICFIFIQAPELPWDPEPQHKLVVKTVEPAATFNPVVFIPLAGIRVYQFIFSKQQGDVCNFKPSCSHFAYKAIKKYGLLGIIMTFDRLERCNGSAWNYANIYYEVKLSPKQGYKLWDPPRWIGISVPLQPGHRMAGTKNKN